MESAWWDSAQAARRSCVLPLTGSGFYILPGSVKWVLPGNSNFLPQFKDTQHRLATVATLSCENEVGVSVYVCMSAADIKIQR